VSRAALLLALLLLPACRLEQVPPARADSARRAPATSPAGDTAVTTPRHFLGLRTAVYRVPDLDAAKAWYTEATGIAPYFDEPYYVGFNIGGYELGLMPDEGPVTRGESGVVYWGVTNADSAFARLLGMGATSFEPVEDHGVRIGAVRDPWGNILGVVENPAFRVEP
jgi:predicted enzyme related to lactoylglutathione lyase